MFQLLNTLTLNTRNCAFLIVAAVVLLYAPSMTAPFIYDDLPGIVANGQVRSSVMAPLIHPFAQRRPLTVFTFAVNYFLGKLDPRGYHLGNIILHAANALLVFFLVRKILWYFPGMEPGKPALATALLFAVHPVHTEVVAYAYNRSASLAAFFFFVSFLAFIRFYERRGTFGRWR